MILPTPSTPIYTTKLPSTGETIKYRPFLVKDEKALFLAQQSDDMGVMLDTLKTIIGSCITTEIDIDRLALFDVEYMFLQLRTKSVGEVIGLTFKCQSCNDPKANTKVDIDLSKIQVDTPPNHQKNILLFDTTGVVMKYPSIDIINKFNVIGSDDMDSIFDIIYSCIDFIYSGEEMFYSKDINKKDFVQFVDNLTKEQFQHIKEFFETMPKLKHIVKYQCPVCSAINESEMVGLNAFFS